MDYISELANAINRANKKNNAKIGIGVVSNNTVVVNGKTYTPIWGGDFDVKNGDRADCVIEGNKCVVIRCGK